MPVGRLHIWFPKQAIDTVGVMPAWSTPAWKEENRHLATLLGAKLRAARGTAKISQERLAQVARLHRTEIGAVERGAQVPSLQTLLICADALDLDPGDLIRDLPVPQERRSRAPQEVPAIDTSERDTDEPVHPPATSPGVEPPPARRIRIGRWRSSRA
jgi:transcriptional regulator with XRE-family HTH domain